MEIREQSLKFQMAALRLLHESKWPRRLGYATGLGALAITGLHIYTSAKTGHAASADTPVWWCGIGDTATDRATNTGNPYEISGIAASLAGVASNAHCAIVPLCAEAPSVMMASQTTQDSQLQRTDEVTALSAQLSSI